jgi:hypothetical protein
MDYGIVVALSKVVSGVSNGAARVPMQLQTESAIQSAPGRSHVHKSASGGARGCIIEYECKRVAPPPSWARWRRRCPTRRARDTHAEWCLWPTCQYCWCHDRIIKHAHYHDTHSQHTYTHESFIICAHSRPPSAIQCSLLLCL